MALAEHRLSDQDMVDILEDIAENARNAAARIAAIKVLREIRGGDTSPASGFEALDGPAASAARAGARLKAV
jgi:hypothetical protein